MINIDTRFVSVPDVEGMVEDQFDDEEEFEEDFEDDFYSTLDAKNKKLANIVAIEKLSDKIKSGGYIYVNCKEDYKAYFAEVSKFLKMKYYCDKVGIKSSHLSTFMNTDYLAIMSIEKCQRLYNCIQEETRI